MKKILLFGGSGLVGTGIKQFLSDRYQIIAPLHNEVDVINKEQVSAIIEQIQPETIIYAVGLTSVDKAEEEPKLAYSLNAEAPKLIAKEAASFKIPLLYFSTDAVFDGTNKDRPYKETDKLNPLSIYGKSKVEGERAVMNISNKNYVVRIIMPYSMIPSGRKNFVWIILDAFREGKEIYGITDQVINPICTNDIAEAVHALLVKGDGGVYHLGATNHVTNIEFIRKIARIFNFNENLVKEISFEDFFRNKKARRTKYCWLDTSKFEKEVDQNILHSIDESLEIFYHSLINPPPVPINISR